MACNRPNQVQIMLTVINKVMATTDGRDKAVRTCQFAMRFLTWLLPIIGYDPVAAQHTEAYILDARRLFRIMKEFDSLEKVYNLLKTPSEGRLVFKILAGIQQMGLCGLYLSNHALLASKLRIIQCDHSIFRQIFGGCFSVALAAGLLQDIARLYLVGKLRRALLARSKHHDPGGADAAHTARSKQLAQLAQYRREILLNLLRNAIDQIVAANVLRGATLHKGAVGAAGVLTSLIQLWQLSHNFVPGARPLGERMAVELLQLCE
jgi:hypothetical protein